jgi:hypothetical protein
MREGVIEVCGRYFDDLRGQPLCFFAAGISGYGPDLLGWIFEEGWIRLGRPCLRLRRWVSGTTLWWVRQTGSSELVEVVIRSCCQQADLLWITLNFSVVFSSLYTPLLLVSLARLWSPFISLNHFLYDSKLLIGGRLRYTTGVRRKDHDALFEPILLTALASFNTQVQQSRYSALCSRTSIGGPKWSYPNLAPNSCVIGHPAAFALQWLSAGCESHQAQLPSVPGVGKLPWSHSWRLLQLAQRPTPRTIPQQSCTAAATTTAAGFPIVECQTLSPVVMHTALTRGKSNS